MKIPFISRLHKGTIDIKPVNSKPKKVDISKLSAMERMRLRNKEYLNRFG